MNNPVNIKEDVDVQEDDSDFGIEFFEDVLIQKTRPGGRVQKEEKPKGFIRKTVDAFGESGVLGILGSEEGRRHVGRSAARVGETVAGLPGDIRDLGKFVGEWVGDKARSMIGKEPLTDQEKNDIKEQMKPSDWDFLGRLTESLPTSHSLREGITRKYTGEYLEPQNAAEAFADDVAQDFAALALPIKGKIPFARSLGTSLVANAGGEVAGAFGGEDAKNYTKLGLLFTSGMIGQNKGGVKKYINGLYNDMEASIPEGASVTTKGLSGKLNKIEAVLRKGDPKDISKQPAMQKIDAIRNKIKSGSLDVDEVIELTKSVNESIYGLGELKRGQNQLYKIREALHDTAKEYGSQNPDFLSKWKDANQAYAATETSRRVGNWVKKNIKVKDYLHAGSALGLEAALVGAPAALGTAGAAGGVAATAYSAEVLKRIAQSPALRRYYTNTVNSALKENKAGLARNIKMLNDGLEKDFKQNPFDTVEFEDED